MRIYRISKPDYVDSALLGHGSALYPGRWNSKGVRLAYTAASVSLAMLEMLVHIDKEDVPADRLLLTFEIPNDGVRDLHEADLPQGWDRLPYCDLVRLVGDEWIEEGDSLALRVPSVVARYDHNILVNPAHPRFHEVQLVTVEPLALDARLFE